MNSKKVCERYQSLSKEKKSDNIVGNVTKL